MELKKFEKNITSQWGEDGVIEEIFKRIGFGSKICCEFGAWDGKHMSNTWKLWHDENWSAVLIEGEKDRCDALANDLKDFPKVQPVNNFVEITGENSLDSILDECNIKEELDLLSIDIDSDDYAIFESLKRKPRLIVIEYNPTVPPHIDLVQKKGNYIGSSVSAIHKLAKKKGYSLVHLTYTNMLLLRDEDMNKIGFEELDFFHCFHYDALTYVINSYDGQTFLSRSMPYAPYLEQKDQGIRNYIGNKYLKKSVATKKPEFDSSSELIYCSILQDK